MKILYRVIKWLVWLFYPRITVEGQENLPQEPVLIVSNHAKMNGPIACELYSPVRRYTWCAGQMMHLKEVPAYAYQDFWSHKPKGIRWFYKVLSYVIAPLCVVIFNNAQLIAVYRDTRLVSTFKTTVKRLEEGNSVVIFPEHDKDYNHILCDFQERFVDIAKLYYKKTGKVLQFVPMYLAPSLKKMVFGKPVSFDPTAPIDQERQRICAYLKENITQLALELPPHTVIPYRNIPKKLYPISKEVSAGEKTHR